MTANTTDPIRAVGMGRNTLRQRERSSKGQEFDKYFFDDKFDKMEVLEEPTTYLEILNYTDGCSLVESQALKVGDDFNNFLAQQGIFSPPEVTGDVQFVDGIRLVVQQDANAENTFSPDHISLPKDTYKAMMDKFRLPRQILDASTVVGPFFWWAHHEDSAGKHLQMVFQKSDVQWRGHSRGWQMVLSYSFQTRVTSGFFKGKENARLGDILAQLKGCGGPAHHPLLLPVLMLCQELGAGNDEKQKKIRSGIRELDMVLTGSYRDVTAAASHRSHGDLTLDRISQKIADYQSKVNWKRPQAWRSGLGRMQDATRWVGENIENPSPALDKLHQSLLDRLLFYSVKLDGLENYAHVSLARLDNLRQVTNGLISQVESRLNAEIAIQQHILANASKRDSASVKTLTILGAVFLPGTFLSSMFSMPFFEFHDMNGPVSKSLWIYFVLMVPLTVLVVGIWWGIDQRMDVRFGADADDTDGDGDDVEEEEEGGAVYVDHDHDHDGAEAHLNRLEGQILKKIRNRTGAQLTWPVPTSSSAAVDRRRRRRRPRSTGTSIMAKASRIALGLRGVRPREQQYPI